MAAPTIDHRGPEFAALARQLLGDVRQLCGTAGPVAIYPSSGTGAWEAALVNTLSPGDAVLAFETGHFATLWGQLAGRLGLEVDFVPGVYHFEAFDTAMPRSMYGGLAVAVMQPERREKPLVIYQSQKGLFDTVFAASCHGEAKNSLWGRTLRKARRLARYPSRG